MPQISFCITICLFLNFSQDALSGKLLFCPQSIYSTAFLSVLQCILRPRITGRGQREKVQKIKAVAFAFSFFPARHRRGPQVPRLNLAEPPLLNLVSLDSLKKTVRVVKVIYLFGTKEKFRIYFLFHGVPYLYVYE